MFAKVSKSFPENYLSVIRSKQYIKWRYIKNPHHKYYIFGTQQNKHLEGIVIFNIIACKNYKNLEIKDILFASESAFNNLLSFIMKWSINNGISTVNLWEDSYGLKKQVEKLYIKMVL